MASALLAKVATALDLDDGASSLLEASQMGRLVGVALLLQQRRVLAVFARLRSVAAHVCQIEGGRVRAPHEAHEIRGGQKDTAVEVPH